MSLRQKTATGDKVVAGAGRSKLYDEAGQNEDGAMTQKAATDQHNSRFTVVDGKLCVVYDDGT